MTDFIAGAGHARIHFPQEIFPLEGFCGVHDEPYVRLVILEQGERIVLVSVELVMLLEDSIDALRSLISEVTETRKENIWIHLTHAITTPHAPGEPMIGPGGQVLCERPGISTPDERILKQRKLFEETVYEAVLESALEASGNMQKACIGMGTGYCDVNGNRDVETSVGWWIGAAADGPSNKEMSIVRIENLQGKPIAFLMNYGVKPCAVDNSWTEEGRRLISSDVPGRACTLMEEKYQVPVLFLMSAAGDQVPKKQAWYDTVTVDGIVQTCDKGVSYGLILVEEMGREMAIDAIEIAEHIRVMKEDCPIYTKNDSFSWNTKERIPVQPRKSVAFETDGRKVEVPVYILIIGELAFVGTKPELNCVTERKLKEESPYPATLFVSMVNGGMKYMPEEEAYRKVTWETMNSMLMPGAAEAYVEKAVQLLQEADLRTRSDV